MHVRQSKRRNPDKMPFVEDAEIRPIDTTSTCDWKMRKMFVALLTPKFNHVNMPVLPRVGALKLVCPVFPVR